MKKPTLTTLLRRHGIPLHEARAVAHNIEKEQEGNPRKSRLHNWDRLLLPLQRQIQTMGSTQKRWDAQRISVYAPYLALLRKVCARIKLVAATNARLNDPPHTIPECAAELSIPNEGLDWADWVPERIKAQHRLAFEKLYLTCGKGKRVHPFTTVYQRSTRSVRWDVLLSKAVAELHMRGATPDVRPVLLECLKYVRKAITERAPLANAPVQWEHLLPTGLRDALTAEEAAIEEAMRIPINNIAYAGAQYRPDPADHS